MIKARPHIMLQGGVTGDAVTLWQTAFPDLTASDTDGMGLRTLMLGDLTFTLFDSPPIHKFGPTPSWSMMVDVDTAEAVDNAAAKLGDGGSILMPADSYEFAQRFVWVQDRFGISWQIRFGAIQ
ncbi:VOC family protein [Pseudooctadecabacter sp.]|uniref:VOC family protein n=1 Tax=Pseudooctadecabacter sp. TaxID=1966338 RepID=UPI0035C823D7